MREGRAREVPSEGRLEGEAELLQRLLEARKLVGVRLDRQVHVRRETGSSHTLTAWPPISAWPIARDSKSVPSAAKGFVNGPDVPVASGPVESEGPSPRVDPGGRFVPSRASRLLLPGQEEVPAPLQALGQREPPMCRLGLRVRRGLQPTDSGHVDTILLGHRHEPPG